MSHCFALDCDVLAPPTEPFNFFDCAITLVGISFDCALTRVVFLYVVPDFEWKLETPSLWHRVQKVFGLCMAGGNPLFLFF